MSITAPETEARLQLIDLINAEFTPEGYSAIGDRLHESLGDKGTRIGVSPQRARPTRDENVLGTELLVQFYGKWDKDINPEQVVNPTKVETYAERFRRALRTSDPKTGRVWFFRLTSMDYPEDPTGNKSRFEATVVAVGENSALIESSG